MNWTLEDVIEFVEACYDRDTILDVLMGYSGHWFPSRMILIVGRAWVQLFSTTAFDLPHDLARELRRADVDAEAPAISQDSATGTIDEVGLSTLFGQLEIDVPMVRTIGVRIGSRVAIVLVGGVHDEAVETDALEAAAAAAGRQLEDVIRMAKANELPPVAERIPPMPDRRDAPKPPGAEASEAEDGRKTQNLGVSFDKGNDAEDDDGGSNDDSGAPRLSAAVEDDSNEDLVVNPTATSFGLPFMEGEDVAAPGRAVADDSSVSESSAVSEVSAAQISEASGTREGAAFRSEAAVSEANDEEQEASSPIDDDASSPEEIDEQPSGELNEDSEGVQIIKPTDISTGTNRTQLGGVAAADPSEASLSEVSDNPGTLIGSPNMVGTARSTHLGGVGGDADVVEETLERAESEAAAVAASDVLANDDDADGAPSLGAWSRARSKTGVPKAMILKRARRRNRNKTPQQNLAEATKPKAARKTVKTPPASPLNAPANLDDPSDPLPGELDPPDTPLFMPGTTAHTEPTRIHTNPLGPNDTGSDEPVGPNQTSFGSWNRDDEDQHTRRFDDGDGEDAWFDYFADEAKNAAPKDSEAALNFSLSEPSDDPHTIPPETLERLLDSGPAMVDMQEQFIVLDSRDRDKAFEAAERIAELGEKAIEVLDLMFPGRVFLDRYQFGDDLPPVDKHGPVLHALVRLADLALPVAQRHLEDSSNEARFYAVYLLTKLDAEPVLEDLFARLFDRDQQIRRVTSELVLQYQSAEDFEKHVQEKVRGELLSKDDVHVTVAASLLARLRDTTAIATLIDAMDDSATPRVKLAILNALTEITLHHWSSPYEWRQWWRTGKKQQREDWLVEALDAASTDLRQLAYSEIQRIPGLELNYHPDQPGKLRKRAQNELRAWFAQR